MSQAVADHNLALATQLALKLAEIAEEVTRPGYHGHGLVQRFQGELYANFNNLDEGGDFVED